MSIIQTIATPLMGALIGYGTNYVAIKMLFRPRTAKYIGKFKIPFTPGIIPAQRDRIAHAIGDAIGKNLFTGGDIHALMMNSQVMSYAVDAIMDKTDENGDKTVKEVIHFFVSDEKYNDIRKSIHDFVIEKIMHGIDRADIVKLIETEGVALIREKLNDTLFGGLISDGVLVSLASPVGESIKGYVNKNGNTMLDPIITREIENIEDMPLHIAIKKLGITRDGIKSLLIKLVDKSSDSVKTMFEKLNIAGTVEKKISAMDVRDVEKLVLSVMNKELNAIVNLGAILGLALGILMLFIK